MKTSSPLGSPERPLMVNGTFCGKYVVCFEGRRARVLDGAPARRIRPAPFGPAGVFVPGLLLSEAESAKFIQAYHEAGLIADSGC